MMNVLNSGFLYADKMISSTSGVKVLLLDNDTLSFVSISMTKTELFEREVVLVDQLSNFVRKPVDSSTSALNCICILRPTSENIEMLSIELGQPHFQKYNIFFTNSTSEVQIRQIAAKDVHSVVETVHEAFFDFYALNQNLFSLNINDIASARNGNSFGGVQDRIAEGLFSFVCSQRVRPYIRYDSHSSLCQSVANSVSHLVEYSRDMFGTIQDTATVLVLDRRSDPILPLIHNWYYFSALHDSFGIDKNIVEIGDKKFVLNERTDPDSARYSVTFISELSNILNARSERYKDLRNSISSTPSDISDFHEKIAAVGRGQTESVYVNTHLDLLTNLLDKATEEDLAPLSQLEQIIATVSDPEEHASQVLEMIRNPKTTPEAALRLVLLYVVRYEKESVSEFVGQMMGQLEAKATWNHGEMRLIDGIIRCVGENARGNEDIFASKSLITKFRKGIKNALDTERSQFELYKPLLCDIIDRIKEGKLKEEHYPYVTRPQNSKTTRLIVFYVGGTTYEEMRIAYLQSQSGFDVVVGGTSVHNSKSFLQYEISPFC